MPCWIVSMRKLFLFLCIAMATVIISVLYLNYDGTSKEYYCNSIGRGETETKRMLCSPQSQTDVTGTKCNNECAKRGLDYYWCETGWTGWGFLETKLVSYVTSWDRKICVDDCAYHKSKGYYYCYTRGGKWDYCSPFPNITYRGDPCRADHRCDLYGLSYYWCFTSNSWDYCGVNEESQCEYNVRATRKLSVDGKEVFRCTDKGNRRRIKFVSNENANIADGKKFKADIMNIISQWCNKRLTNIAKTLVKTKTFRIDMQGMVNRNGQRYHNLQVQHNKPRQGGRSTSFAQVLLPEKLPEQVTDRYVRRAFIESFERQAGITIEEKFMSEGDSNP